MCVVTLRGSWTPPPDSSTSPMLTKVWRDGWRFGKEEKLALKRYIHCHLTLLPTLHGSMTREDAEEILTQFGFQYVDTLLRYCSDELKEGVCHVSCLILTLTLTLALTHSHTGYHIMSVRTTQQFKKIPVGKVLPDNVNCHIYLTHLPDNIP